jgi:hypothetical protein
MERSRRLQAQQLAYRSEIEDLLCRIESSARLWSSAKRAEYEFCGRLAAWESVSLPAGSASRWSEIWKRHCLKHHLGKPNLTLADPVGKPTLSERWQVSPEETVKSYKAVIGGMAHVFRATLDEYHLLGGSFDRGPVTETLLLRQLIESALRTGRSYACPEGLESFLLTLIGLLERSLGGDKSSLLSQKRWREELARKRLLGPPATRTLADVVPLEERMRRQRLLPETERIDILVAMLPPMRRITQDVGLYIESHSLQPR